MGNLTYIHKRIIIYLIVGLAIGQSCVHHRETVNTKTDLPINEYNSKKMDSIKKIIQVHILTSDKANLKFKPF